MTVLGIHGGAEIPQAAIDGAMQALAEREARWAVERRRWRERKRAWRFLKRGGTVIREDHGGAVGIRWSRASRSEPAFDTEICERWLEQGRLLAVSGTASCFAWRTTGALG